MLLALLSALAVRFACPFSIPGIPTCRGLRRGLSVSVSDDSTVSVESLPEDRKLGSQELLFLPRPYQETPVRPTVHTVLVRCSTKLNREAALSGVRRAVEANSLLRCRAVRRGSVKRIDLMDMVREGDEAFYFVHDAGLASDDLRLPFTYHAKPFSLPEDFSLSLDSTDLEGLWKVDCYEDGAVLWTFNHAISDQGSFVKFVLQPFFDETAGSRGHPGEFPGPLEDAMVDAQVKEGDFKGGFETGLEVIKSGDVKSTLPYLFSKATETFGKKVLLTYASGGEVPVESDRQSYVDTLTLSVKETDNLLQFSRNIGCTVSHVMLGALHKAYSEIYSSEDAWTKTVFSLDVSRFSGTPRDQLSCAAGSFDVYLPTSLTSLSSLAKEVKRQTDDFVSKGFVKEAVRVWDFATNTADVTNLVTMTASGTGRGYTLSLSNAGKVDCPGASEIFFATGQKRTGAVNCMSAITVNGKLCMTCHGVEGESPVERRAADILRSLREEGEAEAEAGSVKGKDKVRGGAEGASPSVDEAQVVFSEGGGDEKLSKRLLKALPVAAAAYGVYGVLAHYGSWSDFFENLQAMKLGSSPEDYKDALNFWIFFAVAHPLLQPVLWISEVMHGSIGPKVGDLVPVSFLLGNVGAIWALSRFKEVSSALNIFLVAAFVNYVGSGLAGTGGLGDFNLQLNDPYKGTVVKGCPAYEDVRQPSMDDFDIRKYEGLWYEHAFHDWTQFKEVYDTTLDIKVDKDGLGWKDDFALRGPSPKVSFRSGSSGAFE